MENYMVWHCVLRHCYDFDLGITIMKTCREFFTDEVASILFDQVPQHHKRDFIERIPLVPALGLIKDDVCLLHAAVARVYNKPYLLDYPEIVRRMAQYLSPTRVAKVLLDFIARSNQITKFVVDQVGKLLSSEDVFVTP